MQPIQIIFRAASTRYVLFEGWEDTRGTGTCLKQVFYTSPPPSPPPPMTTQPGQEYYAGQKLGWPKILCCTKNGDIGICLSIKCACNTQILKSAARYVGTISCPCKIKIQNLSHKIQSVEYKIQNLAVCSAQC